MGTVALEYVLGEGGVRLQKKVRAFRSQVSNANLDSPALGSGVSLGPYFQKCLLFSKQFMHQGNVAETTR